MHNPTHRYETHHTRAGDAKVFSALVRLTVWKSVAFSLAQPVSRLPSWRWMRPASDRLKSMTLGPQEPVRQVINFGNAAANTNSSLSGVECGGGHDTASRPPPVLLAAGRLPARRATVSPVSSPVDSGSAYNSLRVAARQRCRCVPSPGSRSFTARRSVTVECPTYGNSRALALHRG
jgi:hypothetical protein